MIRRPAAAPVAAAVLSLALVAAACGGDDDTSGADAGLGVEDDAPAADVPDDVVPLEGDEVDVTALDNSFRVQNIEVAPGTTVTWTNKGRNDHDVLPVEGDDWGVEVEGFVPGDVYSQTFEDPGVFRYFCSIHGTETAGMIGTVVVTDESAE